MERNLIGLATQTPMKAGTKNPFIVSVLIAGLGMILAGRMTAQTFTTLHSFDQAIDGNDPHDLVLSSNRLYGTTKYGGSSPFDGMVFAINTDGTGFTNLHCFTGVSDGAGSVAGLILSGITVYGTTLLGGASDQGTVFAISTDGTCFTNLYSFSASSTNSSGVYTNSDGALPRAGLILWGNMLYGTANQGGSGGNGTVFGVSTNGTGFTNLHSFRAFGPSAQTNSDGANPEAGLILSGGTLYGTAEFGGRSGQGTVFAVNTDGTGFTNLHSFTALFGPSPQTNRDGANPSAGLLLSGNTLYGTTELGGSGGNGTAFAVSTNGTGFTNLHSFTAFGPSAQTNSDGAHPDAGLILSGSTLYGTTEYGGSSSNGTVFSVNTDGTGFTTLYNFTAGSLLNSFGTITNCDGANPLAGLILSSNTLYGTAQYGGITGEGTVFSLSLRPANRPELTIIALGTNVILTWPTSATGFTLQSSTNLLSPVWTTNLPPPVVVNGQFAVTNPITGSQQFYRLSQ